MILVGTAGWTDKSLIDCGNFYPPEAKSAEDRLRYYASKFPFVEIDSSYYGLPSESNARLWADRTPPDFRFNMKAFRIFTGHQTPPAALPKDIREALRATKNVYYKDVPGEVKHELWQRFRLGLEPLRQLGKLGAVHFQFPPWMAFHRENFQHIEECRTQMEGYLMAVELRNSSWFSPQLVRDGSGSKADKTLHFERELAIANVVVDEPQGFSSSIPSVWEVTNPELALVRLHGRNAETWDKKGLKASSERFNYDYNREELADLAGSIAELEKKAAHVDVVFNNNYHDQGQRNATTLVELLAN